jgi:hypothetical protein
MGLVYVVADQQCVLVFASHRHSSYRFGFLRVGPRRPSPVVVYNTVRGTGSSGRGAAARAGRTRRADRTPCGVEYDDARSRRRRSETARRHPTPACRVHPHGEPRIGCAKRPKSGLPRVDSRRRHVCETERRKAEPCGESTVLAPPGDGGTAAARARARLGR